MVSKILTALADGKLACTAVALVVGILSGAGAVVG